MPMTATRTERPIRPYSRPTETWTAFSPTTGASHSPNRLGPQMWGRPKKPTKTVKAQSTTRGRVMTQGLSWACSTRCLSRGVP
ncbi:hypothetical protein D3C86_1352720 [compost metagenome]